MAKNWLNDVANTTEITLKDVRYAWVHYKGTRLIGKVISDKEKKAFKSWLMAHRTPKDRPPRGKQKAKYNLDQPLAVAVFEYHTIPKRVASLAAEVNELRRRLDNHRGADFNALTGQLENYTEVHGQEGLQDLVNWFNNQYPIDKE